MSNQSQIEALTPAQPPVGFSAEILKASLEQGTTSPPVSEPDLASPSAPEPGLAPPSAPEATNIVTYRQVLQNPNFRLLWIGQGITTFGSFFTRVAIPIYVYTLTGSYTLLGFSLFVSLLPTLLFGLFAGALVDRWDHRRTMVYTDIANSLLLCGLIAVIVIAPPLTIQLGAIYAISFCASILREMFTPARIAIFTDVVSQKELLTANSLDQSTQTLGELLSYPVAAYALLQLGPELAFGIDAASFLVSALLIWGVKVQRTPVEVAQESSIWQETKAGLILVNRSGLLRKIAILSFIVPMAFTLLGTLTLPFVVEKLGSTAEIGFPALEAALALGITVGMLVLGRWGQRIPRWKLLAMGIFSFGVVMTFVGLVPRIGTAVGIAEPLANSPWTPLLLIAMPLSFLEGITNSMILACIRTVMQEESPRGMIGRVASVVTVAAGVGASIGALLTSLGEGRADTAITIIGLIILAIGLFSFWWLRPSSRPQPTL